MSLTNKQVRRLALAGQGLLQTDQFGRGINAVERAVKQLHYLQIDTISVVERAHHHVLKTRVSNFSEPMLHRLHAERRAVFEYWSHAAAYLPIDDYRFYLPVMQGFSTHRKVDAKLRRQILHRIRAEGPMQSRDFEDPRSGKSGGWWDWKPSKRVLEHLFLTGELMVAERQGFQKVYDLAERVLPDTIDTAFPTDSERGEFYVLRMLAASGIATARDIGYARATVARFSKVNVQPLIDSALQALLERQQVVALEFAGERYFALSTTLEKLPTRIAKARLRVLSPFDNLVINRRRLAALFNFDYQLECYVPEKKRRFGYFTLPLLLGDRFIGRMDCKMHRKEAQLLIKKLWLETDVKADDALIRSLGEGLRHYALSIGCQQISLLQTEPTHCRTALLKYL
jgi:uncharacterized protein